MDYYHSAGAGGFGLAEDSLILLCLAGLTAGWSTYTFRLALRFLNHIYVVDKIFSARLSGKQHAYTATNTVETPTVQERKEKIEAADQWLEQYVAKLTVDQLAERISFKFTDGDTGAMSREEILFHLLAHGAYHRGNVGMLLSDCGVDRPKDTFTRFLHQIDPSRRD